MGLYNFHKRFAPFVLAGTKTHTIRSFRRYPDKPGNTLHLYTGLRTKKAKLLMVAKCVKIEDIRIELKLYSGKGVLARGLKFPVIFIDDAELTRDEMEALARRDGFNSFADMLIFWSGRLPFRGHVIHWRKS